MTVTPVGANNLQQTQNAPAPTQNALSTSSNPCAIRAFEPPAWRPHLKLTLGVIMSTLATYLQISNNLPKWQKLTAAQPDVKQATAYYEANIGSVKTPADLVNNYRTLFLCVECVWPRGSGLCKSTFSEGAATRHE